jgi:hypothetical protein
MKKLNLVAAALLLASSGAFAATASDSFDVTVNFTSSCSVKTPAADLSFSYTAFQTTDAVKTASTVFECSRGLTPTFQFDSGTDKSASAADAATISGAGLVKGLRYTLDGSASKTQTGTAADTSTIGTADEYTVSITGTIVQGQAGDPTGVATQTRTLTIAY